MGGFQSFSTKKSAWDLVRLSPTTLSQTFVRHQPQKPCSCWTWWRDLQAWQHLAAVIDWEEHRSHMIGLIGFRGICMIYEMLWKSTMFLIVFMYDLQYIWRILKMSPGMLQVFLACLCRSDLQSYPIQVMSPPVCWWWMMTVGVDARPPCAAATNMQTPLRWCGCAETHGKQPVLR